MIHHLLNEIYCVEVAEDASDVQGHEGCVTYYCNEGTKRIKLPPGNWQFLFLSNGVTEKQAHEIVYWKKYNRKKWYRNYQDGMSLFTTALESFQSLLKSKNLTGNQAIIQKIK